VSFVSPGLTMAKQVLSKGPRVSDAALKALARYWFRAQLMRKLTHQMKDKYLVNTTVRRQNAFKKRFWEFDAYVSHWLSALFVVVEGFNKVKMRDERVQKLFKENVGRLKQVRHETYHFSDKHLTFTVMIGHLNWAEDLHEAIGEAIADIVYHRELAERFLEYRAATKE
jgi:hypothetical protein